MWSATLKREEHSVGRSLSFLLLVPLLACSSEPVVLTDCDARDGLTPICGFQNPEDLALLPGGAWIVVSQYAADESQTGSLVGFRLSDSRRVALFPPSPRGADLSAAAPLPGWGSPDCPGPPDRARFAPHGIDLTPSGPTGAALAVVNHGGREAVELFEVGYAHGGPALGWRGCIVLPPGLLPNDVAFLSPEGVVVTNIMPRLEEIEALWAGLRLVMGGTTGSLLEWKPESGWRELEESHGSGPIGVAVSRDGSAIFFTEWGGKRLVRLRPGGSPLRQSVALPHHPDGISWTRDGRLLVTGQKARLGDLLDCLDIRAGTCAVPFSIVAAEPATLEIEVLIDHPGTASGAASSAIQVGGELLIGTFAGDRLARAAFPQGLRLQRDRDSP